MGNERRNGHAEMRRMGLDREWGVFWLKWNMERIYRDIKSIILRNAIFFMVGILVAKEFIIRHSSMKVFVIKRGYVSLLMIQDKW